jgi:cytochrome P450
MKAFTPKAVQDLRAPIRDIARQLIDEIEPRGRCDFVRDFGYRLPIILFLSMMRLPLEDGDYLLGHAHRIIRGATEHEKHEAIGAIFAYLDRIVAQRRADPGEDLISRLHQTQVRGEGMTQAAVHAISVNLLLGGLDTVASMLGFILQHLAGDAAVRRRLASEPGLIDASLNELIRRFPVASLARVVSREFDYKGLTLKAGDALFLPTALHSFDEAVFPDPMRLDLDRDPPMVLSFGRGPHQCLGSYLARVELSATLTEWLARIPEFRISPGAEVVAASGPINAIASLPLEWTPSNAG